MRRDSTTMRSLRSVFLCLPALLAAAAHAAGNDLQPYLPAVSSFEADYVVIAPDPTYDAFGQKLQAAMREHAEWLRDYTAKHPGENPLPYHPNFGVPKDAYYKYQNPVNHFIELSRQRVRISQQRSGTQVKLSLQGQQLLFDQLDIDTAAPSVKTTHDSLPFREKLPPGRATIPPGAHEGIAFVSTFETIKSLRLRESVFIGRLTEGTKSGVLHYGLDTPGKTQHCYLTYPLR
jgi:hypothetical protein